MRLHYLMFTVLTALACFLPFSQGCQSNPIAPILPGNDPLVVNTERAAKASLAAFEAAVTFDHDNLAFMKANLPQVHEAVQVLRRDFPTAYNILQEAKRQYKAAKSVQTADALNAALAKVQDAQRQSQDALAKSVSTKDSLRRATPP